MWGGQNHSLHTKSLMKNAIVFLFPAVLSIATVPAQAGPIGLVSGSLTVSAGPGCSTPMTVSQTNVPSLSLSVSAPSCDIIGSLSATPLGFNAQIGGGLTPVSLQANGASEFDLSIPAPADVYGYVMGVLTATLSHANLFGEGMLSLEFNGGSSTNIFLGSPNECEIVIGLPLIPCFGVAVSWPFKSDLLFTGETPVGYSISSSWDFNDSSAEQLGDSLSYTYTASFVPVPEPAPAFLAALGLSLVLLVKRMVNKSQSLSPRGQSLSSQCAEGTASAVLAQMEKN